MSFTVQPLEALPKRTVSPGAGRKREPNPFDDLLIQAYDGKAARYFLIPAKQVMENFPATDDLSPAEQAVRTARRSALYLNQEGINVGLDTVIQEDGSVAFRVREKRVNTRGMADGVVAA